MPALPRRPPAEGSLLYIAETAAWDNPRMRASSPSKLVFLPFGAERFLPRAPREGTVMGVVQHGMLIGALVKLPDGCYAQVNGDIVQPLNSSRVEHAIRRAGGARHVRTASRPSSKPAVIVKRRRMIDPALRG